MKNTVQSASHVLTHLISQQTYEAGLVVDLKKIKHVEVKQLAQDHPARQG